MSRSHPLVGLEAIVISMHLRGLSTRRIAKCLGGSQGAVARILRRAGVMRPQAEMQRESHRAQKP